MNAIIPKRCFRVVRKGEGGFVGGLHRVSGIAGCTLMWSVMVDYLCNGKSVDCVICLRKLGTRLGTKEYFTCTKCNLALKKNRAVGFTQNIYGTGFLDWVFVKPAFWLWLEQLLETSSGIISNVNPPACSVSHLLSRPPRLLKSFHIYLNLKSVR